MSSKRKPSRKTYYPKTLDGILAIEQQRSSEIADGDLAAAKNRWIAALATAKKTGYMRAFAT